MDTTRQSLYLQVIIYINLRVNQQQSISQSINQCVKIAPKTSHFTTLSLYHYFIVVNELVFSACIAVLLRKIHNGIIIR